MENKHKIIYMGSGYRPLESLINNPSVEIDSVYVRQNPIVLNPTKAYPFVNYIEELCQDKKIPLYQPEKIDNQMIDRIKKAEPDFLISCGYHLLLPKEIIDAPKIAAINVHPGKLPEYRGQSVIEWAMINNDPEIYMTIHMLNEKFDDGEVLMSDAVNYENYDNGNTIQGKLYTLASDMIKKFMTNPQVYLDNSYKPIGKGKYHNRIKTEDYKINWNSDVNKNINITRAMVYPRDGAYSFIDGEKIIIDKIEEVVAFMSFAPQQAGEIVDTQSGKIKIATDKNLAYVIDIKDIRNYFNVHDKLRVGKILE